MFTGYAFWGVGFLLFVLVLSMLHDRVIVHALPPAAMAPSLWIVLGPAGVGAAALVDLAHAAPLALGAKAGAIGPVSLVGAGALWGIGAWSLLVALALLGRYLHAGRVPYGLGWWGFTFPLGALTLATSSLATRLVAHHPRRHRPRAVRLPRGGVAGGDRRHAVLDARPGLCRASQPRTTCLWGNVMTTTRPNGRGPKVLRIIQ